MSSGFHDVQFPPDCSYGATGGPRWSTTIETSKSGFEWRNQNWDTSLRSWSLNLEYWDEDRLASLIAFNQVFAGPAYGFRFKDWSDYKVTDQALSMIDATHGQLCKRYVVGSLAPRERKITKPVAGTLAISRDGVDYPSTLSLSITGYSGDAPHARFYDVTECLFPLAAGTVLTFAEGDMVLAAACNPGDESCEVVAPHADIQGPHFGSTPGWSLDATTGIVTFAQTQAGHALTASFEFDVPARFEDDAMDINMEEFRSGHWQQIKIVELRS